jgi:hypothetical protein
MGMIQQGVNQLLNTAGTAARLAPGYETRQQLHALRKKEENLKRQAEFRDVDYNEFSEGKTAAAKDAQRILEEQAEVAQKQFELKPSKKSAVKSEIGQSAAGEAPLMTFTSYEDIEGNEWDTPEEAEWANEQIRGQQRAVKEGRRQVKQKRNFMNYLRNIELGGGGTVGDLPAHAQKAIASQYSSKERKALMDKVDKQGGNK